MRSHTVPSQDIDAGVHVFLSAGRKDRSLLEWNERVIVKAQICGAYARLLAAVAVHLKHRVYNAGGSATARTELRQN